MRRRSCRSGSGPAIGGGAARPARRRYGGRRTELWNPLLLEWLLWMRHAAPQLALRAEVGLPGSLIDQVAEGILDIAVVYAPHQRPGLKIELLVEEKLVLVTTSRGGQAQRATDYVFIDWGPDFAARHNLAFPELSNAGTFVGLGLLGSNTFSKLAAQAIPKEGGTALSEEWRLRSCPVYGVPLPCLRRIFRSADAQVVTPALWGGHVAGSNRHEQGHRARPSAAERLGATANWSANAAANERLHASLSALIRTRASGHSPD